MKIRFKKLLKALELNENPVFSDGKLHKLLVDPAKKSWLFELEFPAPLEIKDFEELMNNINQIPSKFKEVKSTHVQITYDTPNFDLLPEYYDFVLQQLIQHRPRFSAMSDFEIEHSDNRLQVVCPKDGQFVTKMLKMVKKELQLIGFDVVLATRICDQQPSIKDKIDQQGDNFTNKISKNTYAKRFEKKFVSYSKKRLRGEMAAVDTVPKTENDLSEYKSMNNDATFQVEGVITKIDSIDIRNNTTLYTFIISSDNDSVYVKKFSKQQSEKNFFNDTLVGMIARVKGTASYDNFSKEVTITAYQFERTTMVKPTDIRKDTADKKRVELHLHTKMSTLDGINNIDEYVETAMKWGHDAIAVTDHGT
ncbi:MAG: PHP domain-containing protein, partial [Candidatus Izimaplasma sp.]|nr:PHP domain-containing protein [Candidatus Izimaplasma bacterium]